MSGSPPTSRIAAVLHLLPPLASHSHIKKFDQFINWPFIRILSVVHVILNGRYSGIDSIVQRGVSFVLGCISQFLHTHSIVTGSPCRNVSYLDCVRTSSHSAIMGGRYKRLLSARQYFTLPSTATHHRSGCALLWFSALETTTALECAENLCRWFQLF